VPGLHGTAVSWENHVVRRGSAFVVELGPGRADAERHARAVLALARSLRSRARSRIHPIGMRESRLRPRMVGLDGR
jgi:hypothetical protein